MKPDYPPNAAIYILLGHAGSILNSNSQEMSEWCLKSKLLFEILTTLVCNLHKKCSLYIEKNQPGDKQQ